MPVLVVPQTQVVPYDAERVVEQRKAMDEFRAQAVNLWSASPKDEIKVGGFRGTRTYDWRESYDALLQTYFVYPKGLIQRTGEVAKVAVLLKKDNCQMLGSAVIWGSEWAKSLPAGETQNQLTQLREAASRKFSRAKSPVRLSVESYGYWSVALAWTAEAILGEKLAAEGISVHSDLAGVACFKTENLSDSTKGVASNPIVAATPLASTTPETSEPLLKRGHRQVRLVLQGQKQKEPQRWPLVRGQFSIVGLPLNARVESVKPTPLQEEQFGPMALAVLISKQVQPVLHDLSENSIKVAKREGRFVIVERGLAYGLRIGMHLVGPDGAKLHVIRFENRNGSEDAAVLLIRKEQKEKPLAAGAVLQVDATQFPLK